METHRKHAQVMYLKKLIPGQQFPKLIYFSASFWFWIYLQKKIILIHKYSTRKRQRIYKAEAKLSFLIVIRANKMKNKTKLLWTFLNAGSTQQLTGCVSFFFQRSRQPQGMCLRIVSHRPIFLVCLLYLCARRDIWQSFSQAKGHHGLQSLPLILYILIQNGNHHKRC